MVAGYYEDDFLDSGFWNIAHTYYEQWNSFRIMFISRKIFLLTLIEVKRQSLPEINLKNDKKS